MYFFNHLSKHPLIFFITITLFSCKSTEHVVYTDFGYKVSDEKYSLPYESDDKFTIAVFPDIQNCTMYKYQNDYTSAFPMNFHDILDRQVQFVADNAFSKGGSIVFSIFLGDMVSKNKDYPIEWEYADNAVSLLDGVMPFGIVIGNHDYDMWTRKRKRDPWLVLGTEYYTRFFGPQSKHFLQKSWYGGASENGLNSYIIFTAGKTEFLFVGLEFEPSDEALDWAQKVISEHKNLPCIISTHGYITLEKENQSGNNKFIAMSHHKAGEGNSGQTMFEKVVYPNKNVFLVLCGHVFSGERGEGMRVDMDADGYKVYSILSNYQGRDKTLSFHGFFDFSEDSGDGLLRLMNFDLTRNIIQVQTYSTEFNTFEIDSDSDFVLDIDWDWKKRFSD